ncbi:hypothetical protein [Vampirovibrio sp.]|uniref:hypothetical protein n=1 Tax=Vampirovibrio sp. TaxID=2717857 RepID=UPI003593853D
MLQKQKKAYQLSQQAKEPQSSVQHSSEELDPDDLAQVKFYVRNVPIKLLAMDVSRKTGNPEVMRYLGQVFRQNYKNIDVPVFPSSGLTLLHVALNQDNPSLVQSLLDEGADPRVEDKNGQNAFERLAKRNIPNRDRKVLEKKLTDQVLRLSQPSPKTTTLMSWLPNWFKASPMPTLHELAKPDPALRNRQAEPAFSESLPAAQKTAPAKNPEQTHSNPPASPEPSTPEPPPIPPKTEIKVKVKKEEAKEQEAQAQQLLAVASQQLETLQGRLEGAQRTLSGQQAQRNETEQKNHRLKEQLTQANQAHQNTQAQAKLERHQAQLEKNRLEKKIAALEKQQGSTHRTLTAQLKQLKKQAEQHKSTLEQRTQELRTLKQRLKAEASHQEESQQALQAQISELEKQHAHTQAEQMAQAQQAQANLTQMQANLRDSKQEIKRLKTRLSSEGFRQNKRNANLEVSLRAELNKQQAAALQLAENKATHQALQTKLETAETQISRQKAQIANLLVASQHQQSAPIPAAPSSLQNQTKKPASASSAKPPTPPKPITQQTFSEVVQGIMHFSAWKRQLALQQNSINDVVMSDILKTLETVESLPEAQATIQQLAQYRMSALSDLSLKYQLESGFKPNPPQLITRSKSFG